jgi:hypothetical protein
MYELIDYLKNLSLITIVFKSNGFYTSLICDNFQVINDILIGYHHLDNNKIILKVDLYQHNENLIFNYENNIMEINYQ